MLGALNRINEFRISLGFRPIVLDVAKNLKVETTQGSACV
jgi:hypothetical protein